MYCAKFNEITIMEWIPYNEGNSWCGDSWELPEVLCCNSRQLSVRWSERLEWILHWVYCHHSHAFGVHTFDIIKQFSTKNPVFKLFLKLLSFLPYIVSWHRLTCALLPILGSACVLCCRHLRSDHVMPSLSLTSSNSWNIGRPTSVHSSGTSLTHRSSMRSSSRGHLLTPRARPWHSLMSAPRRWGGKKNGRK